MVGKASRDHLWQLLADSQEALDSVQAEFSSSSAKYAALRRAALSSASRWEWTSSFPRYHLDPLYFLNDDLRRGRSYKNEPARIQDKHQYAFDQAGRLVASRLHTEFPGQFYEEFLVHETSSITSFLFHHGPEKWPINCARLLLDGGVPNAYHFQATHGHSLHIYVPERSLIRYFCSLHVGDDGVRFGGCGELRYPAPDRIEQWYFNNDGTSDLVFSGKRSSYYTIRAPAAEPSQ
jgi:hypothetical protein